MSRSVHPNALPSYEKAVIPEDKLCKYSLDPKHVSSVSGKSSGRDKARVFESALGFNESNWELLRDRILEQLPYHEAIIGKEDEYGKRYRVDLSILGANLKVATVITAWIVRPGADYPSLISAYCAPN